MHAMVLETVEQITENNKSSGFEIGDHKLVFKNTYDNEDNGKPKRFTMNVSNQNTPDLFYYVHIDVDLNQLKNVKKAKAEMSSEQNKLRSKEDHLTVSYQWNFDLQE